MIICAYTRISHITLYVLLQLDFQVWKAPNGHDHGKRQSPQWVESLAWSSHGSPNGCFVLDYQWLPVDWNRGTPVDLFQDTFISTSCPKKTLFQETFYYYHQISSNVSASPAEPHGFPQHRTPFQPKKNNRPAGFFMVVSSSGACPGVSWDGAKSEPSHCLLKAK